MNRRIVSYYSIFVGLAVILMWTVILLRQEIPEGKIEMFYHLFSEFLMAILCVVSGILFLFNYKIAKLLNILGLGMVIYSVLNAAGYYSERENVPMILMFTILFLLTTFAVFLNLKSK
jgi:hypothetical protein